MDKSQFDRLVTAEANRRLRGRRGVFISEVRRAVEKYAEKPRDFMWNFSPVVDDRGSRDLMKILRDALACNHSPDFLHEEERARVAADFLSTMDMIMAAQVEADRMDAEAEAQGGEK